MCYTVLVVLKIMYGGKIMNLITSSFCRAVARHSAPRARLGDAESTKLSTRRGFSSDGTLPRSQSRAEYDHCSEEGTLILGVDRPHVTRPERRNAPLNVSTVHVCSGKHCLRLRPVLGVM